MGTVDSFLCDRLGAGFATDPSTGSRTQLQRIDAPGFDARLCEIFGVPPEVLPEIRDTAGELGTLSHPSWPVELPLCGQAPDQQAALAGRRRGRPGPGQGDVRHRGVRPRPRRRGGPGAGRRPAADDRLADRRQGRVRARRRRLRRRGDARVDVSRARASPPTRRRWASSPAEAEESGGALVLPGLAGIGAPWWRPDARAVLAGISGGTTARPGGARSARGDRLAGRRRRRGDPRVGGRRPACGSTAGSRTSR